MPDLDEESEQLTKDGLFYQADNKNNLEVDEDPRADPVLGDKPAPDIPFGESGSKGAHCVLPCSVAHTHNAQLCKQNASKRARVSQLLTLVERVS